MKNITYGYANEGRGLPTLMQFVRIKHLRHIKYAVAHAQCFRPMVKADDRKIKSNEGVIWHSNWYVHDYPLSTQNTGMYNYVMNIYFSSKP